MVFYNPFVTKITTIPTIVYPSQGAEHVFDGRGKGCIENYLCDLFMLNQNLLAKDTRYMITVVWEEYGDRMADVRMFRESPGYGLDKQKNPFGMPGVVRVFRDMREYVPQP